MEFYKIILQQLGGNKFLVMTGAKNLVYCNKEKFLKLELPKNPGGVKWVKITLNYKDLYNMEFLKEEKTLNEKLSNIGIKIYDRQAVLIKKYEDLFFDQLQEFFTETTGFYTSL